MNTVFENELFLCSNCNGGNYTKVISAVGAELKYCTDCNSGKENVDKELKKDILLKEIVTYVNNYDIKDELKIEISNIKETLSLNINDVCILKEVFPFKLEYIEVLILKSLIADIVNDIAGEECVEKLDLSVVY